jgi:predicted ATP-dependent serine protease
MMSSEDMMDISYDTLNLKGKWGNLLGKPAKDVCIMLWGMGGQGKTTAALQLARTAALQGQKVLYVSSEQYGSLSLVENLTRQGGAVQNLFFSKSLSDVSGKFDWLFFDSINNLRIDIKDFQALRAKYPKTAIVMIFQATKEGNFKGSQEWQHDCDTVIKVHGGVAKIDGKNRYQSGDGNDEIRIF